jgi:hypothetical protein
MTDFRDEKEQPKGTVTGSTVATTAFVNWARTNNEIAQMMWKQQLAWMGGYALELNRWMTSPDVLKLTTERRRFMNAMLELPGFKTWKRSVDEAFKRVNYSPAAEAYKLSRNTGDMSDSIIAFLPEPMASIYKVKIMKDPVFRQQLTSPEMADLMYEEFRNWPGNGELYGSEFNNQLLTEDSQGNIQVAKVEDIDKLFERDRDGHEFPHVIMTSSHAFTETKNDVSQVIHGIQALARHSQGKPLDMIHLGEKSPPVPNPALILFACDTEVNPQCNGTMLLRRLHELRAVEKRFNETGELHDDFKAISPGAKRIAKLMLRQMASKEDFKEIEINDSRPISEIFANRNITLRSRPELIAQHFATMGFSKGGNVVSDAMRYLVSELTAKNKDGEFIVKFNGPNISPEQQQEYVRGLVRNIFCFAGNSLEEKMLEPYKLHGVRRLSVNCYEDNIAQHEQYKTTWGDEFVEVNSRFARDAHNIPKAWGRLESDMKPEETEGLSEAQINKQLRGYVLDDEHVNRRLKEATAPLYGKATISSVSFIDPRLEGRTGILIGTGPGTPDEMLVDREGKLGKAGNLIVKHMEKEFGKGNVALENLDKTGRNGRAFVLNVTDKDLRNDDKALQKLYNTFHAMRDERVVGLLIADRILHETGPDKLGIIPEYARRRYDGMVLDEPKKGRA